MSDSNSNSYKPNSASSSSCNNSISGGSVVRKRISDLNYIRFDVGHQFFTSHRSTILAGGSQSLLAKMISSEFDTRKSSSDYIIIDRDGKHFGTILNFLRDPRSLNLVNYTDDQLDELAREADYYSLTDLLNECDEEMDDRIRKKLEEIDLSENKRRYYSVPENRKLEIIYGSESMLKLMSFSERRVIVISYKSLKIFHLDDWFEELITSHCDYKKNVVYCFKGEAGKHKMLTDFIMLFYDPSECKLIKRIKAPSEEKFKSMRSQYKYYVYKYWFIHNKK